MGKHPLHEQPTRLMARTLTYRGLARTAFDAWVDSPDASAPAVLAEHDAIVSELHDLEFSVKCLNHAYATTAQLELAVMMTDPPEIDDLRYHLAASKARDASPFDIGDIVEVRAPWRMGDREGDGGFYYHDAATGVVGRVTAFTSDGDEIRVTTTDYSFDDFVPACRVSARE